MNSKESIFQIHCETGNIYMVKEMVMLDVNWSDEGGVTALQVAAANGRDDIVEYLLCHDAVIDKPNNFGWTSLMHAARNGYPNTVSTLIHYGANVQLTNGMGAEVMALAVASGNCLAVGHILSALPWKLEIESATILTPAIVFGHNQLTRILLDLVRPNDALPHTGITPLMMAALKGNSVAVDLLLEHDADVNKRNVLGQSALDIAVTMGHGQVMQLLQSDNCHHIELRSVLPDLVTGIAVKETGGSEIHVPTEKNAAYVQIRATLLEERDSQLCSKTPQRTKIISQYHSDSLSPSFHFTEPWTSSTDTNIVPTSATTSSFSLQNPDMSATYTPKIEYCTACFSHHLSNPLHCLNNKSSYISKLDMPRPVPNMCRLTSVITKLQNQTDKPSQHVIQPFIPCTNNMAVPSMVRTFISPGSMLSPPDNKQIAQSTTQTCNLRIRTISPQSNTHVIHNPSLEAMNISSTENNYKLADIPCSLLQPCVSTEDTYLKEATYRELSPQTKTRVSYRTQDNFPARAKNTESHNLPITAIPPHSNIKIYHGTTHACNLPSRGLSPLRNKGLSPLRNMETYSLANRVFSPQINTEIYHGTSQAYNTPNKGLSPLRNTEAYSLADRALSPQCNTEIYHGTSQAYNTPNKGLSPLRNTEAYSLADRALSPQISHGISQAYSTPNKGLSPLRNTEAYSLADRALSPQCNTEIYHGTSQAYNTPNKGLSPLRHTEAYSLADRALSPQINTQSCHGTAQTYNTPKNCVP
ncbi:uncharacterized protein LOC110831920 isoform X2 [Zootermopsis nevadensis]|uniref:uncharacterized protein LOC110831920 isoform X2 n=1 Tax=Zootermopsis nevadensis TaxID=136037 RepID=UPI000B8E498C|nr:uncharacterized protein LOC110831920 isoform X2 [Zootermopsis nevadensis]